MTPETAFNQFQTTVNADPSQIATARSRRDAFVTALSERDDIEEVVVGGSLRRGTQRAPINDVDIYPVFSSDEHPEWGEDGVSAHDAIELVAERIGSIFGKDGTHLHLLDEDDGTGTHVRLKGRRRHSIKCFIDNPKDEGGFTVDVVPSLRHDVKGLLIPERDLDDADNGRWIRTDPEYLVAAVSERQAKWSLWVPTVRILKHWSERVQTGMSSLYVEVLALNALPTDTKRSEAVQRFFNAVEWSVSAALQDPAQLCGAIQPDLDVETAKTRIAEAAALSRRALADESNENDDDAVCAWRAVFGPDFPEPPCGCEAASAKPVAAAAIVGTAPAPTPKRRAVRQSPQG